jgi:hypothetical protein
MQCKYLPCTKRFQIRICIPRRISVRRLCIWVSICICLALICTAYIINNLEVAKINFMTILGIRCSHKERITIIRRHVIHICQTLNSNNITYFLDRGTLLGAIRHGDILPQDDDADLSYLWKDRDEVLKALGSRFRLHGIVDLLRWSVNANESTISRVNAPHEAHSWLNRLIIKRFSGFAVDDVLPVKQLGGPGAIAHCKVPAKPHEYLRELYGPHYMDNVTCS